MMPASKEETFHARPVRHRLSGSGIDWHDVESYFRPQALGKYSFAPGNVVVFNKLDRLFDVAIMMDCSQRPVHPQLKGVFKEYARKDSEIVRKHGARPVFFMSFLPYAAGLDPAIARHLQAVAWETVQAYKQP